VHSSEYCLLELADGRVYMNKRWSSRHKCRAISFSKDGGITWSNPVEAKDLPQPQSPGPGCHSGLIRLTHPKHDDKSRVLFTSPWGKGRFGRQDLTVQISYDECESWKPLKVLQTGNTSYSNLIVFPDKSIGCIYELNDLSQKIWQRIMFCRFTLEWLTDGKDTIKDKENKAG
jgi:sialidase-1